MFINRGLHFTIEARTPSLAPDLYLMPTDTGGSWPGEKKDHSSNLSACCLVREPPQSCLLPKVANESAYVLSLPSL
jgi:hypothetical protein